MTISIKTSIEKRTIPVEAIKKQCVKSTKKEAVRPKNV
jgi:hypothetical protein